MDKQKFSDLLELTKPRITALILVITTLGYYLGGQGIENYFHLFKLLFGTAFVCAGSAALNHYMEREFDSKMLRTKDRPIPSGRVKAEFVIQFGIILTIIGLVVLYVSTNRLVAFLSLLTSFLYILVYTPMKRVSWFNTTIGAVPGALPTLGGWAAATGNLDFNAGILFLILFVWQHPHFYAIAWMFRDDYNRGGFKMLPCVEPSGKKMFQQILGFSFILIPVSLIPTFIGLSGNVYGVGAFISGIALLYVSIVFIQSKTISDARKLLKATVFYLPVLLCLLVVDANF